MTKKRTLEEFITQANNTHNGKFDYSQVIYLSGDTRVSIRCLHCNQVFQQPPRAHLKGHGCLNCENIARRCSPQAFLDKAKEKHGEKYDYTKSVYINAETKILIICLTCGLEFLQTPHSHLLPRGCPGCGGGSSGKTTEQFIQEAIAVHGNAFDYSLVNYINGETEIQIKCNASGNTFSQTPHTHLRQKGCPECHHYAHSKEIPNFTRRAISIHGNKYDYTNTKYIENQKVSIRCNECNNEFVQSTHAHLLGSGCPKCAIAKTSKSNTKSFNLFIAEAKKVHGDKYCYDVSRSAYTNTSNNIPIRCLLCGDVFIQSPHAHLRGNGCKICSCALANAHRRKTTSEFIEQAMIIHGSAYDYSSVEYVLGSSPVAIGCKKCNRIFNQAPSSHLTGRGCPRCAKVVSKSETAWLDSLGIRQSERQKKVSLGGKLRSVDAYNPETNTIYEFYGDYWHGNPAVFNQLALNASNKKPFGELYKRTVTKEDLIKQAGYNLITMWEFDWEKQC